MHNGAFCPPCVREKHPEAQYKKDHPSEAESEAEESSSQDPEEEEDANRAPSDDGTTASSDDAVTDHLLKSRANIGAVAARLRLHAQDIIRQAPRPAAPLAPALPQEQTPAPTSSAGLPKMGSFPAAGIKRRHDDDEEADDEGVQAQQGRRKIAKMRPSSAETADFLPVPPSRESPDRLAKWKRSRDDEEETEEEVEGGRGRRKVAKMRQPTAAIAAFLPAPEERKSASPVAKRKRSQGEDDDETEEEIDGGRGRRKIAKISSRRARSGKE
ncbi:mitochondrial 2-methylisocitrate lyase [Coniosporium tulheliwenetii]|uniref:Mitochondrial 2-methylisocitrate lyase n=1 Tax=Coniosporium tulheliwenetii TaxID=3383036 RepID=A0ACC2YJ98_9PEZI|nr:mitochondrial 2-methylisocitrate lyase [Cladosporium sp. JES 115]